jgi:hypothetical protein
MYTHKLPAKNAAAAALAGKLLTEQRMAPSIYMTGRREKSHMPQQEPKCFPPKKKQPKMYLLLGARGHKTEIVFLRVYYVLMKVFIFPFHRLRSLCVYK